MAVQAGLFLKQSCALEYGAVRGTDDLRRQRLGIEIRGQGDWDPAIQSEPIMMTLNSTTAIDHGRRDGARSPRLFSRGKTSFARRPDFEVLCLRQKKDPKWLLTILAQ
jgi:hypothetical protein